MAAPDAVTYAARWLFPGDRPPLEGGTLTVAAGRVAHVGPAGGRAPDVDLGDVALIPGLVNAHCHLDLSGARGRTPPRPGEPFPDWLRAVVTFRRTQTPADTAAAVAAGLAESLAFGTTLLGDVSSGGASWAALAGAPLRAVVFRELLGLTPERAAAASNDAAEWLGSTPPTETCRPGLAPHAPFSVRFGLFAQCVGPGDLCAFHLAESVEESELLATKSGPFVPFLEALGVWDSTGLAPNHAAYLARAIPGGPTLFVHGNTLDPARHAGLFGPASSLIVCPRTHAAFGRPPHPWPAMRDAGVRVAVGTDGLSSNPDLDVLAELRFLRERHPDVPGAALLAMGTRDGAAALGLGGECGALTPGLSADAVAVPLPPGGGDPYELLLGPGAPAGGRRTMFRGTWR